MAAFIPDLFRQGGAVNCGQLVPQDSIKAALKIKNQLKILGRVLNPRSVSPGLSLATTA